MSRTANIFFCFWCRRWCTSHNDPMSNLWCTHVSEQANLRANQSIKARAQHCTGSARRATFYWHVLDFKHQKVRNLRQGQRSNWFGDTKIHISLSWMSTFPKPTTTQPQALRAGFAMAAPTEEHSASGGVRPTCLTKDERANCP